MLCSYRKGTRCTEVFKKLITYAMHVITACNTKYVKKNVYTCIRFTFKIAAYTRQPYIRVKRTHAMYIRHVQDVTKHTDIVYRVHVMHSIHNRIIC